MKLFFFFYLLNGNNLQMFTFWPVGHIQPGLSAKWPTTRVGVLCEAAIAVDGEKRKKKQTNTQSVDKAI